MSNVKSIGLDKEEEWPVNECRFGCGAVDFELVEVPAEEGYAVECCGCGARGPIAAKSNREEGHARLYNAQQMAVEKWNN